jgi:Tol biopolymer transport system component
MSDRDSRPEFDVYRMNADGTRVERLTTGGTNWFPQYSPDGARLALHVGRDVHILDLETRRLRRLTTDPLNGMYPTWSPDGERLAFMSWRNGRTQLFTMNADGTEQRLLVSMPRGSAIDPRWSPDGARIAFVHVPEETVHDAQRPEQTRLIYTVELASGRMRRLSR